ncbi:hypothetical protein [Flavobacterium sp. JAS]|uniref:hypothetical protein n=1 Tax=Flavobacterium sp. JAS TaxID=2897329 RepID=UPI001E5362AB|nr:hypothetical protein [Flavobacterium sp. JAS]MCD0472687.1 hypothetical protein [Flavobacterium sp. JAS]
MENNQNRNYDTESHNPENEPWTPYDQKPNLDSDLIENFDQKNEEQDSDKEPIPYLDEFENSYSLQSSSNPQNDDENDRDDGDDDDFENEDIEEEDDDFLEKDIDYKEKIERDSIDKDPNI